MKLAWKLLKAFVLTLETPFMYGLEVGFAIGAFIADFIYERVKERRKWKEKKNENMP